MTENKRFTYDSKTVSILKDGEFWLDGNIDTACNHSEICEELNNLHEEKQQVKKVFQKYFNRYTQMAVELRHDKYGNAMCHDVTEIIQEIADELEMELEDWE